ncbi:hypothetical protein PQX77_012373 [Marasmius sp. AFHP31]|nr:hypothetical protein PQX77_012373 [Marasmius sp. AFHP31]
MAMLEEFGHTPAGKFRGLEIRSLDPSKESHPPDRYLRPNYEGTTYAWDPPSPADTDEIIEARTRLPEILPKALSALKGLGSVKLDIETYTAAPLPFRDLFQNIPPNTVQLRSLLLVGWAIQVTPQVWPHLRSLRSIELPWCRSVDPISVDYTSLWSEVSEELLDILELQSLRGLEVLAFEYAGAGTDEASDRLAQRFYNDVLHRHQDTLRELSIVPPFTGDWPNRRHNLDIFDECKHLAKLAVGLDPDDILPREENTFDGGILQDGEENDIIPPSFAANKKTDKKAKRHGVIFDFPKVQLASTVASGGDWPLDSRCVSIRHP